MKRALILCLFLAISITAGDCASTYFPPLTPVDGLNGLTANNDTTSFADPSAANLPDSSVSYPRITQIEKSLYGHSYANQDILVRVARIEKSIFNTVYSNLTLAQRVDNIVVNFNQINEYPNISKKVLSTMESKVFHQTYSQNDTESRVERLEQEIFGATQSGDFTSRYETLKTAINNYKSNQNSSDYYPDPLASTQGRRRGIVGTLGSLLLGGYSNGYMTGFTPPIDPFNNTSNGYNNNNGYNNFANLGGMGSGGYGWSNSTRSNRGYHDSSGFQNFGSQSRVTILD